MALVAMPASYAHQWQPPLDPCSEDDICGDAPRIPVAGSFASSGGERKARAGAQKWRPAPRAPSRRRNRKQQAAEGRRIPANHATVVGQPANQATVFGQPETYESENSTRPQPNGLDREPSMTTAVSIASVRSRESMVLLGGDGETPSRLQPSPRVLLVKVHKGKGKEEVPPIRVELGEGASLEFGGPGGGAMVNDEGVRCTLEEFVSVQLKQTVAALYYKKAFIDDPFATEVDMVAVVAHGALEKGATMAAAVINDGDVTRM